MPPPPARILGLGETEYRLNWIPLGGYVKMLGQDDLRPGVTAEDPRAYNKKSVGARMIIVSAGVVMNVILAAVGIHDRFHDRVSRSTGDGGQRGCKQPGRTRRNGRWDARGTAAGRCDHFLRWQGNGGRFQPDSAQCRPDPRWHARCDCRSTRQRTQQTLYATPERPGSDGKGLLQLGVGQPFELAGPEPSTPEDDDDAPARQD